MAQKKRYVAPRVQRRERLAKVTEAAPPVTGRIVVNGNSH